MQYYIYDFMAKNHSGNDKRHAINRFTRICYTKTRAIKTGKKYVNIDFDMFVFVAAT